MQLRHLISVYRCATFSSYINGTNNVLRTQLKCNRLTPRGSQLLTGVCFLRPYSRSSVSWQSKTGIMAPVPPPDQLVDQYIKQSKVVIFSKSFCPFCHQVSLL